MDYRQLCASESSVPLFCRDYWLDAVAPGAWDAIVLDNAGAPLGAWPFVRHRHLGFDYLQMPVLTQFLGPWIAYPAGQKQHSKLSHEKDVFTALIERLPAHDYLIQNFHHSVTNWLPFHWQGFTQTTRYTYVLDDLRDPEAGVRGVSLEHQDRHQEGPQGRRCRSDRGPRSILGG